MGDTSNTPEPPKQRHVQEYEDPHYHDDDELPASEDSRPRPPRPPARRPQRPHGRRSPPLRPRRRYEDD